MHKRIELTLVIELCVILSCVHSAKDPVSQELAYVDGGSLVSLCNAVPVPSQLKTDFLESTLYAQMNASLKYDRQENGVDWYASYIAILQHVGWNISLSKFQVYNTSDVFNWRKAIESVLRQDLNSLEMASLDRTLTSFFRNSGVKTFNQLSYKGDIATFQVIPAFMNGSGNLVAAFGLFTIIQMEQKGAIYDTQATGFLPSISVGVLNEQVYSRYRGQVKRQLAKHEKEYIYELKA